LKSQHHGDDFEATFDPEIRAMLADHCSAFIPTGLGGEFSWPFRADIEVCETCHASFTIRYAYSGGIG